MKSAVAYQHIIFLLRFLCFRLRIDKFAFSFPMCLCTKECIPNQMNAIQTISHYFQSIQITWIGEGGATKKNNNNCGAPNKCRGETVYHIRWRPMTMTGHSSKSAAIVHHHVIWHYQTEPNRKK